MEERRPKRPPIAITMGEPAGVGGEVLIKAWLARTAGLPPFFVLDDPVRLRALAAQANLDCPIVKITKPKEATDHFSDALPVIPLGSPCNSKAGTPSVSTADAVIEAIDRAVAYTRTNEACAIVTSPVHKETLYRNGFKYPGHTEYLAELGGTGREPVMMLAAPELKVVPVTIHMSLADAIGQLDAKKIIHCVEVTHQDLKTKFGIAEPRLAIAGLNPHAGEGGHLGNEEQTIIEPAIAALRKAGINVTGPVPPDTMFHADARAHYDAAICMYHDQALIPIKTLAFDRAVNVTLGLPFIRTSPDHGTAFDIAGTGQANPASMIAAIGLAAELAETTMPNQA